ncbi:hypothetical protein SGR_7048t [Streptomyces griseus subsp. griseus NBRC 13350]|uniref:Uncharacterized protein n=1 Tax=Streptomyces griseus subsp. griseus (strain JCM 4626 / CBS 651.72 / NBRC 13350 / KCC S-0626 / ISP 5235) TaxID=455632 RepID=B1VN97_STRGG|nr:hypothetical protein SGR_91t [Streptomyces griseus subsp. griseus NBRC 13350]BAG23875.1 hypothetical protein SGR_7048t [Streptomyces griseus subsp. griseus NBRC 13350]
MRSEARPISILRWSRSTCASPLQTRPPGQQAGEPSASSTQAASRRQAAAAGWEQPSVADQRTASAVRESSTTRSANSRVPSLAVA